MAALRAKTGPAGAEALLLAEANAADLKRTVADLEDCHSLGHLWDIDVTAVGRTLASRDLGVPPRTCLLCAEPPPTLAPARALTPSPKLLATIHAKAPAWVLSDRGWPSAPEAR